MKTSKRMRHIGVNIDKEKMYSLNEALDLLSSHTQVKFDQSMDVAVKLGVDTRKSDQQVRGVVSLPHGVGRSVKVAVFASDEDAQAAKDAGADTVGMEDLAAAVKKGHCNYDVVITHPSAMPLVGQLGKILGPKGLMPNPKTGTVTTDIGNAVRLAKAGQMRYRADQGSIIHGSVGRVSFAANKLADNILALLTALKKTKPAAAKGTYFKKLTLTTTMGGSVQVNLAELKV